MKKEKLQEKKPVFLKCKLEKTETGVKLIGIYETEIEIEKNGKKEIEKKEIEKTEDYLAVEELDQKIRKKLEVYGLFVKVQRVNAGVTDEKRKLENWKQTISMLKNGDWERKPDPKKAMEKAKLELINSISDPKLKEKLKKELGLA